VLRGVESWIEEKENGLNTIMEGDFNTRTEEMGAEMELSNEEKEEEEKRGKRKRKSEDKKMNREGRLLVDFFRGERVGNPKQKQEG